jgi:hypothetical protein
VKVLLLAQFLPPMGGGEERHVWTHIQSDSVKQGTEDMTW